MPTLTRRQQTILDHLRETPYAQPPTLDELCAALGLKSRGSMHKQIQALVTAGMVEPMEGRQRGVRLTEAAVVDEDRGELPMLGHIAAGYPIEAVSIPESVQVPPQLRSERPCYVLRVKGDSMIEDGIFDGDWVVIERRDHARNHEVVVALVDGEEATLKRIEQLPGEVILHPANGAMEPMHFNPDQITIQGVVVGQMRRY